MRFVEIVAVLAAALCPTAVAHFPFQQELCFTSYSKKATNHVSTHTSRSTLAFTLTLTQVTVPTITKTPIKWVTTTTTTTAHLTLPQITDTLTATQTDIVTSTSSPTVWVTDTVTNTVTVSSTATVTVSTSPGFTPFASEAAVISAGGGTSGVSGTSNKRSEHGERGVSPKGRFNLLSKRASQLKMCPPRAPLLYPTSVNCIIYVEKIIVQRKTVPARITRTRTARTVTSTSIYTTGTTVTVTPPHASLTVTNTITNTDTITNTITSTTTSTETDTSTSIIATATYYPLCQPNNLIDHVGGNPMFYMSANGDSVSLGSAPDAVTCCQICANTEFCAGFSGPVPGYTDCYIWTGPGGAGSCDGSVVGWTAFSVTSLPSDDLSVIGNGNCGRAAYGVLN
ncbi:hypothetical protein PT974_09704 [Cladobotryum mycophilum]|uniref:Apple domain-containing protein n=1 Tax=Cladobotryum mycophilum TaxID=491253 RepID=A0ABR0SGY6_9HYPO